MAKKVDLEALGKRLNDMKSERVKTSVYFDSGTWHSFKESCDAQGHAASPVLEELMKTYIQAYPAKKARR